MGKSVKFSAMHFSIENIGISNGLKPFIDVMDVLKETIAINNMLKKPEKIGKYNRQFFYDDSNNSFILGLVLTLKNHKSFLTFDDGELLMTEVDKGDITEFNFFIIHKETFTCIYQTLFGGFTMSQFGGHIKKTFDHMAKRKSLDLSPPGNTKVYKRNLKSLGRFKNSKVMNKKSYMELLDFVNEIKDFEYDVSVIDLEDNYGIADWTTVASERRTLKFSQRNKIQKIKEVIMGVILGKKVNEGKFHVINKNNDPTTIKFDDNLEVFMEYDYDNVTKELDKIEVKNIKDSWIVKELLSIAEDYGEKLFKKMQ